MFAPFALFSRRYTRARTFALSSSCCCSVLLCVRVLFSNNRKIGFFCFFFKRQSIIFKASSKCAWNVTVTLIFNTFNGFVSLVRCIRFSLYNEIFHPSKSTTKRRRQIKSITIKTEGKSFQQFFFLSLFIIEFCQSAVLKRTQWHCSERASERVHNKNMNENRRK